MTDRRSIRVSFDRIAEAYAADFADELARKPFDRERLRRFARACGAGLVLDIGCGPAGHVGRFVAEQGVRVLGVELSPRCAVLAQRLNPPLRFVGGDAHALPIASGACAGVVAFYSLIYEANPTPALAEFRRVLKPGGLLLAAVHAGEGLQHFSEYKALSVDVDLYLRAPETFAAQVRAAGFSVDSVELREPYTFEHATQRLYVAARAS